MSIIFTHSKFNVGRSSETTGWKFKSDNLERKGLKGHLDFTVDYDCCDYKSLLSLEILYFTFCILLSFA